MNKSKKIHIICTLAILIGITITAESYASISVDGDLSDWGVMPGPYYGTSQWVPTYPNTYFTVEDQIRDYLNPGYGGQLFDAEAIYITYNSTNLYYAIVTGHPSGGANGWRSGDIAFDFGIDGIYEYGIEVMGDNYVRGALYSAATWNKGCNHGNDGTYPGYPTDMETINGDSPLATGTLVYNNTYYGSAGQGSHYVIEGSIGTDGFGSDWGSTPFIARWTQTCGNDVIEVDPDPAGNKPIPEPASMALLGLGIAGLGLIRRKRV